MNGLTCQELLDLQCALANAASFGEEVAERSETKDAELSGMQTDRWADLAVKLDGMLHKPEVETPEALPTKPEPKV